MPQTYTVVSGGPVTDAQVEAALSAGDVVETFRFEQRDLEYNLIADITTAVDQTRGGVRVDAFSNVPATGDITIIEEYLTPLGVALDDIEYIAISMDLLVPAASATVRFPVALMRLDAGDEEYRPGGPTTIRASLSDVSVELLEKTQNGLVIASGTNAVAQMEAVLDSLGLQHSIPASPLTVPATMGFGIGTPFRTVMDRLAHVVNYYPVVPDGQGVFTSEEAVIPATPSIQYATTFEPRLLISPFTVRRNSSGQFKNRAVVVIDHPDRTPTFVERFISDATSPIAGSSETEVLPDGGYVYDTTVAAEYATWFLRYQNALAQAAEIRTVRDPRRAIRDTIRTYIEDIENGTDWITLGWSLDFNRAQMTQRIGRAQAIGVS